METAIKDGKWVVAKRGRPNYQRRAAGEMNNTETLFSAYLEYQLRCHDIQARSAFEPITLTSGRRSYTPDFKVTELDGTVKMYDCKGCKLTKVRRIPRPHIEPQDRLRLEIFAREFRKYQFVLTWMHRNQWYEERIVP